MYPHICANDYNHVARDLGRVYAYLIYFTVQKAERANEDREKKKQDTRAKSVCVYV